MTLTPDYNTGFEHGLASASGAGLINVSTATRVTIDSTTPRNGTYCLQCDATAAAAANWERTMVLAANKFVCRVGIYITAFPGAGVWNRLVGLGNATGLIRIEVGDTNKIRLNRDGTTETGVAISASTWYRVELAVDASANPWVTAWQLDGNAQTVSGTNALALGNLTLFRLGTNTAAGPAFTARFDDAISGSFTGSAGSEYWGDGKGILILPGSDGTHNTAGGATFIDGDTKTTPNFTNSTTTAWTFLDDAPPWTTTRSTTDNISAETHVAGDYMEIAPAATPETGNANSVRALLAYSSVTATANGGSGTVVRNGSGTETTIFGDIAAAGVDYSESTNFFKAAIVTNPGTWTPTEVNAVRWRIGRASNSSDVSPRPTWQALALEVDYPPAAAAATSLVWDPAPSSLYSR